jgi:Spy/CpxP family protein refolding chaperone
MVYPSISLAQSEKDRHELHRSVSPWKAMRLDESQQQQIKNLHREMKPVRVEHFGKVQAVRDKIREELLKEKPSIDTLYGYTKEINALELTFAEKRLNHMIKLKEILTVKQFSMLVDKDIDNCKKKPMGKQSSCDSGKNPGDGN